MNSHNRRWMFSLRWGLFLLLACQMTLSGCEPLRKKFVRQKKNDGKDKVVPVLEPVDYPSPDQSPAGVYQHHYSLWTVWHKDVMSAIQDRASEKKILYDIDQMLLQMDGMALVLSDGDKKEALNRYRDSLLKVREQFARPEGLRNDDSLSRRLARLEKDVRREISPDTLSWP